MRSGVVVTRAKGLSMRRKTDATAGLRTRKQDIKTCWCGTQAAEGIDDPGAGGGQFALMLLSADATININKAGRGGSVSSKQVTRHPSVGSAGKLISRWPTVFPRQGMLQPRLFLERETTTLS